MIPDTTGTPDFKKKPCKLLGHEARMHRQTAAHLGLTGGRQRDRVPSTARVTDTRPAQRALCPDGMLGTGTSVGPAEGPWDDSRHHRDTWFQVGALQAAGHEARLHKAREARVAAGPRTQIRHCPEPDKDKDCYQRPGQQHSPGSPQTHLSQDGGH